MKAAVYRGERDIRVEQVADSTIGSPTDAVLRVVRSSVCGSDLWPYRGHGDWKSGWRIGHEVTGIVEEVGDDVTSVAPGDLVVSAFAWSCGDCEFCRAGLHTSCVTGTLPGGADHDGCQAELVRVPMADGSLWKVPEGASEDLYDSIHLLSDVLLTGYHAAVLAGVGAYGLDGRMVDTAIVVGDGAVGLSAVVSARLRGAETVIAVGHHQDRLELATQLGATHTTDLRGDELVAHLKDLTDGGAPAVLECVGNDSSVLTAVEAARPGGTVSMVGIPRFVDDWPMGTLFAKNVGFRVGIAPVRAYMDEVGPQVASGELDVSVIASDVFSLDELPAAYEAMDQRTVVKALLVP